MNTFYKGPNNLMKNIYIAENEIMASDEDYGDQTTFLEKINASKKGILDTHVKFEYNKIQKIVPFAEEKGIQLFFNNGKRVERTYLVFDKLEDYKEVLQYILGKRSDLRPQKEISNSKLAIVKSVLYTIIATVMSAVLVFTAYGLEQGETIRASGSKRGLKTLLISLAETLGIVGSAIAAFVVVVAFVYYTFNSYKKSSKELEVYK